MEWWSMTPTEVLKKIADGGTDGIKRKTRQKKRLETDGRNKNGTGRGQKGLPAAVSGAV